MELTRYKDKKYLRCGYTTGSCAAAAAKAATRFLLTGVQPDSVTIATPAGISLTLDIAEASHGGDFALCAVRKDGGDDPDITNGVLVFAEARRAEAGVTIDGGEGVGRVTKPGLNQPVGAAAINSAPRGMIEREVRIACRDAGYIGGIDVVVSIPGGGPLAERTFNPRLGIVGGLSVLGTSGIVEPMSVAAVVDTMDAELRVLSAAGHRSVLLTIGNYGDDFAKSVLQLGTNAHVKCSNFLGDAIDAAVQNGFWQILIVGHAGKLVKLGIGMTNTHSSNGDGRMETLIACALRAGAPTEALSQISDCATVDAALDILREYGCLGGAMEELGTRIGATLRRRVPETVETGFICFSGTEILTQSENAKELLRVWCIS